MTDLERQAAYSDPSFKSLSWGEKHKLFPDDNHFSFMSGWERRVTAPGAYWEPPITPKQRSVTGYQEQFVLLTGPRHSTKTLALLHAIADHCWNIPDASVAFVYISQTNATDAGAWKELCDDVMPQWINGRFGMNWIEEPRYSTYSHKAFFEVTNQWGGTAHVQIYSLPDEKKAEDFFKNKNFTMIAVTELTKFRDRKTFNVLKETLRGIGRLPQNFKFIADTNPANEGTLNWIWQLWFPPEKKPFEERDLFERQLKVIKFDLNDNIFYSDEKKEEIRKSYEYDQHEYARNVKGEWVVSMEGAFFAEQFRYHIHVPGETEDDYLTVDPGCWQLMTSWDLGEGINHAAHIIEKVDCTDEQGKPYAVFKVLDEIISIGLAVGIPEFVQRVIERMDFWEKEVKDDLGRDLVWAKHWSDADAFEYDAAASNWKQLIVSAESNLRIELTAASKGKHSVAGRLNLLKKLLHDDRLYYSKRCPRTILAMQQLKRDKKNFVNPKDPNKHPIDSFSYCVYMENGEEAREKAILATKRDGPIGSGLVHISL